jgi:hypothetical protein
VLAQYKQQLHPAHEYVFATLMIAINAASGEQDYRAKTDFTRQVF